MDAVNDPSINEIVFLKSAQVGGTEAILNIIGFFIKISPSRMLYVCETETKAKAWSKEKLAPMLRDSPAYSALVNTKQRDSNNEIEAKAFPGGHLAIAYATSPNSLSSRPIKVLLLDEVEAFEPTKEGDPVALAEKRTTTAGDARKIIYVSTPRLKENSIMLAKYEDSTAERFFVPCPHCDEFQQLTWKDEQGKFNVIWDDGDTSTAVYVCKHCGCEITDEDKPYMLENGEWRSTNPDYVGNRRGFWINELYSLFSTFAKMAADFIAAKKNPATLQTFVNTSLAEFWEANGEKIDYADLTFNQEDYDAEIPDGVKLLTAGVDVQDDRLELEVIGWGDDWESWSIEYKVIYGNPGTKEIWDELKDYLTREFYDAEENVIKIKAVGVDSGGHHTDEVYDFCQANTGRKYFCLKGANIAGKPIASKPTVIKRKKNGKTRNVRLFTIGTESAKDSIFSSLKIEEEGPGYCHFPANYEESYFKMLCSEKKISKFNGKKTVSAYVKVGSNVRNEALDCRVYGLAAAKILNPDFRSLNEKRTKAKKEVPEKVKSEPSKPPRRSFIKGGRTGKGFVNNWRK